MSWERGGPGPAFGVPARGVEGIAEKRKPRERFLGKASRGSGSGGVLYLRKPSCSMSERYFSLLLRLR